MIQDHKTSFVISLIFFFLLPIFFIPGGLLGLEVAKSTLFLLMTSIVSMVFLYEVWRARQVVIPWHPLILVVLFLPLVYALSAFLSTSALLSLLGYYLEIGTSGFIFLSAVLLILVSTIFFKTSRVFYALITFLVSIATIFLLVVVKILLGFSTLINVDNLFVLGNFFGNLANPLGNWTDLAVMSGLLSIVTALALAMLPMKRVVKVSLYFIFLLGVFILIVSNFSVALILTSVLSFVLLLYFTIVEKKFLSTDETLSSRAQYFLLRSTFLPVVLVVLTLVTFINPTLSDTRGTLNDVLTNTFKVKNIDVRPSFSATLSVSKEVLYKEGLLGSGPNTFGRDWLVYKPVDINATPFWEVTFPFGVGFIPTQIASTGLLGSLLWLLFLFFIVVLSVKSLSHMPKVGVERFVLTSVLFITVSLWVSNLFYTPSSTMLILAFVFSGMFIAMNVQIGTIPTRILNLQKSSVVYITSCFLFVIVSIGMVTLVWLGLNRAASAFYFKKAVDLSNTNDFNLTQVEDDLNSALRFAQTDTYHVALSRINFAQAQAATSRSDATKSQNEADFAEALRKSLDAARRAVSFNPDGYNNWVSLGMIYSALVTFPPQLEGVYEQAQLAYSEASSRNPTNPELPLLLARLELNHGDREAARSFIRKSIALKENYADAYLLLAQLEIQDGHTNVAIASAEKLAVLRPNNPGIYFELGLLKYANKDYLGAIDVFDLALASTPDYANAKYYLGLSLMQLKRFDEARVQFESLLVTNPGSEEVKVVLRILGDQ